MNRANWHEGSQELFSRSTLELTFRILRRKRPALALLVQNAITLAYSRNDYHTGLSAADMPLAPEVVEEIVMALSSLSEQRPDDSQPHELVLTRSLLLDWLMLARNKTAD